MPEVEGWLHILESECEALNDGMLLNDAIPLRLGFVPDYPRGEHTTDAGGWSGNYWRRGGDRLYVFVMQARRGHGWIARSRLFTDTHQPLSVKRET